MVAFLQILVVFVLSLILNGLVLFLLKKFIKKRVIPTIVSIVIALVLCTPIINLSLPLQDYGTLGTALGTLLASLFVYFLAYFIILMMNIFSTLKKKKK